MIAEFVLLTGVYERAIPVSRAEVVVAAVDGQLRSAGSVPATTLTRQALAAADRQVGRGPRRMRLRQWSGWAERPSGIRF
ncbi:MAG TPA: hypothetical protein VJ851_04990 [Jatrophihabitans sp.]|nr:hypothetical protein [Jatrophihabitans sp.]